MGLFRVAQALCFNLGTFELVSDIFFVGFNGYSYSWMNVNVDSLKVADMKYFHYTRYSLFLNIFMYVV